MGSNPESSWQAVATLTDWWNGPAAGIAGLEGSPYLFQRDPETPGDNDLFLLKPVDEETLALALEEWSIYVRYREARDRGEASPEDHPALPVDRERLDELRDRLAGRLSVDPEDAIVARGRFRRVERPSSGSGPSTNWQVRWEIIDR